MRGSRRATPGPVHERRLPGEARPRTEGLLDPQQPVVLRDPLAPASGTGLEMSGTDGDGEIGERGVLRLAGTMRHEDAVARAPGHRDRLERFGDRADLVELDEDGVRPLSFTPRAMISGFVQKMSSPTSSTFRPSLSVRLFQPPQSFSASPSSRRTIGYREIQSSHREVISSEVFESPPDFVNR